MERIACRTVLSLPEGRCVVLSIGNLEEIKGHRYLLEVIRNVIQTCPSLLCVIVGNGSQRAALEKQIIDRGLSKNVMLVENKPHSEILLWMNACGLFVLPK